jgi:hypothetical protein
MADWDTARRTVLALHYESSFDSEDEFEIEIEIARARLTLREVFAPLLENPDPMANLEFETAVCADDPAEWKNYFENYGCRIMLYRLRNVRLREEIIDVEADMRRAALVLLKNELAMIRDGAHYARSMQTEAAAALALQELLPI